MSGNSQKTPLQQSLHALVDVKSQDWLSRLAKSMPATITKVSGALVTVKLEGNWNPFTIPEITIPVAGSKYVREPLQVGDRGFVIGVDYYIGGQSGEGGGSADLLPRANLTNSVFQSVTQKGFPSVDPHTLVLGGTSPGGVQLESGDGTNTVTVNDAGFGVTAAQNAGITSSKDINLAAGQKFMLDAGTELLLEVGGVKFDITPSGVVLTGNVTVNGTTTLDGSVEVHGTLHSTGTISTDQSVSAVHDVGAGGNLTAAGNATITGTSTLVGAVDVHSTLHSTGTISTDQSVTATHDVGAGGNLTAAGNATINGTSTLVGAVDVHSTLHSTGSMSTDQSVSAVHDVGAGGAMTATGNITTAAGTVSGHEVTAGDTVQAVNDVIIGSGVTLKTHVHPVTTAPGFTGQGQL